MLKEWSTVRRESCQQIRNRPLGTWKSKRWERAQSWCTADGRRAPAVLDERASLKVKTCSPGGWVALYDITITSQTESDSASVGAVTSAFLSQPTITWSRLLWCVTILGGIWRVTYGWKASGQTLDRAACSRGAVWQWRERILPSGPWRYYTRVHFEIKAKLPNILRQYRLPGCNFVLFCWFSDPNFHPVAGWLSDQMPFSFVRLVGTVEEQSKKYDLLLVLSKAQRRCSRTLVCGSALNFEFNGLACTSLGTDEYTLTQ